MTLYGFPRDIPPDDEESPGSESAPSRASAPVEEPPAWSRYEPPAPQSYDPPPPPAYDPGPAYERPTAYEPPTEYEPPARPYDPAPAYEPPAAYEPAPAYEPPPAYPPPSAYEPGAAFEPPARPYEPAPAYEPPPAYQPPARPYEPSSAHEPPPAYEPPARPYDPVQPYERASAYEPPAPYEPASAYEPPARPYDPAQPYERASAYEPPAPYEPASAYEPPTPLYDPPARRHESAPADEPSGGLREAYEPPAGPFEPASFEPLARRQPAAERPSPPDLTTYTPVVPAEPADPPVPPRPPHPAAEVAAAMADATNWADVPLDDLDIEGEDEIAPWDRRPLMVALAAGTALVLLAVLSGVASASFFGGGVRSATWLEGGDLPRTAPPSTAPVVPGAAKDTITLSGVGDVIMGTEPGDLPPRGGDGFFDSVKEALAADLVMGNLETPLTEDTGRVKCPKPTTPPGTPSPSPSPSGTKENSCFQFYLPPSYANHLRDGGFGLLSLANNHTNDMGADGLRNTRSALEAAGLKHAGAPNQITYVEIKGVRVAVIGFAIYSWSQNLNNIPAARTLVKKAAQNADLVVVQMQGGAEGSDKTHVRPGHEMFVGEDRGDLIAFSHAVIDAGADIVFGHGPHIMRGMEFYKGRLIAYSLGNFCGYGVLNSSGYLGVGGVLKVSLHRDGTWAGGQLVATEMVRGGLPAIDDDKRALAFVDGLSSSDFGASAARISASDGTITPPVT